MPVSDQALEPERYRLIPRTLIFITSGEEILLLRGAMDKVRWPDRYNGIGGHLERGEDLIASAKRELFEETGIEADSLWLCGILVVDTGEDLGVVVFIFKGESPRRKLRSSPEGTPEWVHISKLPDLPLVEDLSMLLPRVLKAHNGEFAFMAYSHYLANGELSLEFEKQ
jgi:8-oxo-dGTP diphosphatase